jgi:hypothetical protein
MERSDTVTDLIKDYFVRTLSAAEADALGAELRASEDAARRFALLAEQDYRRLGLPTPGPRERGRKLWLLAAGFLLGAATSMAWFYHPWRATAELLSIPESVQPPWKDEAFPEEPLPSRPSHQRAEPDEKASPEVPPPVNVRVEKDAPIPAAPTPVLRLFVSTRSGGQLIFDIKLAGASTAARAQVLDRGGYVIRALDPVAASQWTWDGRDSHGRLVPKGNYCIQAMDADQKRVKWVKLDAR